LKRATGSFGLCVSCSLDAHRQVVFAARGQTLSVAFYPSLGLVAYGSEAAATKAPLTIVPSSENDRAIAKALVQGDDLEDVLRVTSTEPSRRLDLDDLGGEICLLDWGACCGAAAGPPTCSAFANKLQQQSMMAGRITVTLAQESLHKFGAFERRLLCLQVTPSKQSARGRVPPVFLMLHRGPRHAMFAIEHREHGYIIFVHACVCVLFWW